MQGILAIQTLPHQPRLRLDGMRKICGIPFYETQLHRKQENGFSDRIMLRSALRALAMRGVSQLAIPQESYIKKLLPRYNMSEISHVPLLRTMAPQIMDCILQRQRENAVFFYAKRVDDEVLQAIWHAARYYDRILLCLDGWNRIVQERLMERYGVSAVLGAVPVGARHTAALLFDAPKDNIWNTLHFVTRVALCEDAVPDCEYNDLRLQVTTNQEIPQYTDPEGVWSAVVSADTARAAALRIDVLIKK